MRFVSTRDGDREYSFKEATLANRCPKGGMFVPADIEALPEDFICNLAGLDFPGKMAHCLAYFIEDLSLSQANRITRRAFNEEAFSDVPFSASALNPYKEEEMLILADRGPAGTRQDYANALIPLLLDEWLDPTSEVVIYSDGSLHSAMSLAAALANQDRYKALYFLDKRFPESNLSHLETYLSKLPGLGIYIEERMPESERQMVKSISHPEFLRQIDQAGIYCLAANGCSVISLVTNLSLLLTAYSDLAQAELLKDDLIPDIAIASDDIDLVLAALYLKSMGLGLGQIIIAENNNRIYSDFFRSARFSNKRKFSPSLARTMDQFLDPSFEGLLFELLGRNREELEFCFRELQENNQFNLDKQYRRAWSQHIVALFNNDKTLVSSCRSMYDTTDYLLDAGACAGFASRQLQLRGQEKEKGIIVVSSHNPLWSAELSAEALFSRSFLRGKTDLEVAEAIVEESGIHFPHALHEVLHAIDADQSSEEAIFQKLKAKDFEDQLLDLIFYLIRHQSLVEDSEAAEDITICISYQDELDASSSQDSLSNEDDTDED